MSSKLPRMDAFGGLPYLPQISVQISTEKDCCCLCNVALQLGSVAFGGFWYGMDPIPQTEMKKLLYIWYWNPAPPREAMNNPWITLEWDERQNSLGTGFLLSYEKCPESIRIPSKWLGIAGCCRKSGNSDLTYQASRFVLARWESMIWCEFCLSFGSFEFWSLPSNYKFM